MSDIEYDEYGMPIEAAPTGPGVTSLARAEWAVARTGGSRPKGLAKLLQNHTGGDPDKLQELIEEVQEAASRVIERGSALTRKLVGHTKDAYEYAVQVLSKNPKVDHWTYDVVKVYAGQFIEMRARVAKGKGGGHVKAETVAGWHNCLVVCIARYTYDPLTGYKLGPQLLYKERFVDELLARVKNSIDTLKLDRHTSRNKKVCGLPEARLMIEHLMKSSVNKGRIVKLQLISVIIICLATGMRPSSLCAGHEEDRLAGKFMKMGDFELWNRGSFTTDIQMTTDNWKGHNASIVGKSASYWLRGLTKAHNIMFDTFWIVSYIWARGSLPQYPNFIDLITAKEDQLVIANPDAPFLLKPKRGGGMLLDEAWTAHGLSGAMSAAGTASGLKGVTAYSYRRGFANEMSIMIGRQETSLAMGHKDAESVLTKHYSHGAGNHDLLGIRVGEATDQYRPGAESALQMRVRVGTAVTTISKVIAQSNSKLTEDSDDESDSASDAEVEAEAEEDKAAAGISKAFKNVGTANKKFIADFQEKFRDEDDKLQQLKADLTGGWTHYQNQLGRGTRLYEVVNGYKKTQIGILNNITSHELYKEAAKEPGFLERVTAAEKALRDANTKYRYHLQQVNKRGKIQAEKKLDEKVKANVYRPTIQDKDAALAFVGGTSELILAASKTSNPAQPATSEPGPSGSKASTSTSQSKASTSASKPTQPTPSASSSKATIHTSTSETAVPRSQTAHTDPESVIAELSRDEEEDEEAVLASYKELSLGKQNNLAGKAYNQEVEELVEGPVQGSDLPVEEWKDQDEEERITIASAFDVRVGLATLALDPILFQREALAQIKADGGDILCQNCREFGTPADELHKFSTLSKLKEHMWQQHTEWAQLVLKMKCGDRFKCPGVCGAEQKFDSIEDTYDHCLSDDCADSNAFKMMRAEHEKVHEKRYKKQSKYVQEGGNARNREAHRQLYLKYLRDLTEEDLRELGEEYEMIEEAEPHLDLMLRNLHFMGQVDDE
ncbi:hypothetical protein FRC11_012790 [Ceratobasidium sp. 423]|nr:hypothetical protein FRC11_012790 [Ceratobasidium sp. 423]